MGDYCYQQELRQELKHDDACYACVRHPAGSESEATHKNMYILLFPAASDLKVQCHRVDYNHQQELKHELKHDDACSACVSIRQAVFVFVIVFVFLTKHFL